MAALPPRDDRTERRGRGRRCVRFPARRVGPRQRTSAKAVVAKTGRAKGKAAGRRANRTVVSIAAGLIGMKSAGRMRASRRDGGAW